MATSNCLHCGKTINYFYGFYPKYCVSEECQRAKHEAKKKRHNENNKRYRDTHEKPPTERKAPTLSPYCYGDTEKIYEKIRKQAEEREKENLQLYGNIFKNIKPN